MATVIDVIFCFFYFLAKRNRANNLELSVPRIVTTPTKEDQRSPALTRSAGTSLLFGIGVGFQLSIY